jgi:uncharacterized protein (DUF3084 family)
MEISMSVEWLERIERKIDTYGKEQRQMAAVLDVHTGLLESQSKTLDSHGKMLEAQGKTLDSHSKMLESHGRTLESHGKMLEAQGKTLEKHDKELVRIAVALERVEDDVRGVAEGVIGLSERMDRRFEDVLARLDDRAPPIEATSRHFASKLVDHERRLPKRPRRRRR